MLARLASLAAIILLPFMGAAADDLNQQKGMVKSIELILGLPPMNQLDLSATHMRNCFTTETDLTPYECVPNRIKLDEMNPSLDKLQGAALRWAEKSAELDFDDGDAADGDALNRILWYSARGDNIPYPAEFVTSKEEDGPEGEEFR